MGCFMGKLPIILQLNCVKVMNRQNWTSDEDNTLRQLIEKLNVYDWTLIAQNLRQVCKDSTRTGKQCRQRWYNHLIPTVNKKSWSQEEQAKLFTIHKVYGNKWKDIAKEIQGRTDNDIKNHFYSTLRRSLRRLNKIIGEKNSTSQIRQIKPSVLTTIMDFIYKNQQTQHNVLLSSLKDLPLLILQFASFKPKKGNLNNKLNDDVRDKIQTILNLVNEFNNSYCKEKKSGKNLNANNKKKIIVKQQKIESQSEQNSIQIQDNPSIEQHAAKNMTNVKTEIQMIQLGSRKSLILHFDDASQGKMMFQEDHYIPPIMSHLDDPSAFEGESSQCHLQVIGKHWSPQSWQRVQQQQIDEILEMNYDNM